ncbi:hypothetical protein CA13_00300 [Planctomycetes bacterium CA13]|uniref:Uncharacterized protein n=2 Tax=Novipirellula herctigrandis TaxID=2527986 RepID=A0A5C5YUG6_9BACT|nr:hypothetical protein CA13_00300 [Planctomycetes bacterium CA13]
MTIACIGCQPSGPLPKAAYVIAAYDESAALTASGDTWGRAMEPWFHGKTADIDAIADAQVNLNRTLKSVRSKLDALDAPDDPTTAEFTELIHEYLDWQAETHDTYAKWLATARAENPATIETRQAVIDEMNDLNETELEWKSRINTFGEKLGVTVGG